MRRTTRLTERDLTRIVNKLLKEHPIDVIPPNNNILQIQNERAQDAFIRSLELMIKRLKTKTFSRVHGRSFFKNTFPEFKKEFEDLCNEIEGFDPSF